MLFWPEVVVLVTRQDEKCGLEISGIADLDEINALEVSQKRILHMKRNDILT